MDSLYSPAGHGHGSIQSGGTLTATVAIATGDKLLITDASNSDAIKATSIQFDTTNTSNFLREDGTWADIADLKEKTVYLNPNDNLLYESFSATGSGLNKTITYSNACDMDDLLAQAPLILYISTVNQAGMSSIIYTELLSPAGGLTAYRKSI